MKILTQEQAQPYQNTSLKRGHVVFTSLIQFQSRLLFLNSHLERLLRGAEFLFPGNDWTGKQKAIEDAIAVELSGKKDHYLRLTIFDENLIIESHVRGQFSATVKLVEAVSKKTPGLKPSYLKQSNYLESDLELQKAKDAGFEDVLFFSHNNEVTEASTSNIFIVTDGQTIITPPESSMVLAGITREKLSECLRRNQMTVKEKVVSREDLEKAREIWLTNAVRGLRFVSQFQNKTFEVKDSLYEKVTELFGRYGENYE